MKLKYGCLVQLSAQEAIELGTWVSDYPDADHLYIDFKDEEIEIFNEQGILEAKRDFDYFKD